MHNFLKNAINKYYKLCFKTRVKFGDITLIGSQSEWMNYSINHRLLSGWITAKYFSNGSKIKTHTCGELGSKDVGKYVRLRGFLQYQRIGLFCILRDSFGLTQILINDEEMSKSLKKTAYESYIEVSGVVNLRPQNQINKALRTGDIEVHANEFIVLNEAKKDIPFLIRNHNQPTEKLALQHRYLDLRHQYLQENLRLRSKVGKKMRDFLQDEEGFIEITTPTLSISTPGGSKEFVVPSQTEGKYYSLAQSPQMYKQMAVIGGFEKYFQFAVCYRDEGGKPDRQPEFMQVDIELADTSPHEVQKLVEKLIIKSWPDDLPTPVEPFPSMTYEDAMENYGTDKPDTRFGWKLREISDILRQSDVEYFAKPLEEKENVAKAFVIPDGEKFVKKSHIESWHTLAQRENNLPGVLVIFVKEDGSLRGNAGKALLNALPSELTAALNAKPGDSVVIAVGDKFEVLNYLGKVRHLSANVLESAGISVRNANSFNFLWVVDFPLFETDETGKLFSCHHPFTAPDPDHIELLYQDPLQVRSMHYDLVLNGSEIAGGSIRNHNAKIQKDIFQILGIESDQLSFLLEALECGAPPHGGIALGFDRYISVLRGAKTVREAMAFPKTGEGKCLLTKAPGKISSDSKKLYHLQ